MEPILMHVHNRPLSFFLRSLLISALVLSAIPLVAELRHPALAANVVRPGTEAVKREALHTTGSAADSAKSSATYAWNLQDKALPLISLPDRIDAALDLSLTYSMDRFEFPLFQSLYYSQRAGKYILMVIPKADQSRELGNAPELRGRRAEFIDLAPISDPSEFEANGKSGLRLKDKGDVKLVTTSEGIVYSFAPLADGELRCSQIKDGDIVIDLKYTDESSIETIVDGRGRSVRFNYMNHCVSSITQTWGVDSAAKLKRTWAVDGEIKFAHRPRADAGTVGTEPGKHIPSNAINSAYTEAMAASDLELAQLFGGPGAVAAANGFEPPRLGSQYPLYRGDLIGDDGKVLRGHLSHTMHLYGSEDGTGEMAVYVPLGFISHSAGPTPTDAVVTFYYPRLGNLTNVTLAVFHVADFQLIYGQTRVRIGNIGGPGGSAASYKHSHLEFYRGDTGLPSTPSRLQLRIDPATVFSPPTATH